MTLKAELKKVWGDAKAISKDLLWIFRTARKIGFMKCVREKRLRPFLGFIIVSCAVVFIDIFL